MSGSIGSQFTTFTTIAAYRAARALLIEPLEDPYLYNNVSGSGSYAALGNNAPCTIDYGYDVRANPGTVTIESFAAAGSVRISVCEAVTGSPALGI